MPAEGTLALVRPRYGHPGAHCDRPDDARAGNYIDPPTATASPVSSSAFIPPRMVSQPPLV